MPILAVALNPTIDVWSQAERVRPTVKTRTHSERQRPGGGGVNVARVIAELGGEPELLVLEGGATGAMLREALATSAIRTHAVQIAGLTRISFMVREEETGLEYRFVPEGPEVAPGDIAKALAIVESFRGDFVVASGSLPRNAPEDIYAEIGRIAAKTGARFILDCPGRHCAALWAGHRFSSSNRALKSWKHWPAGVWTRMGSRKPHRLW